jgi:peptidoglycan/xylan/chitin deacetylase (PgdA/CDA1 family)
VGEDRLAHPPVLLYHSVEELGAGALEGRRLFERQVAHLVRGGYRTLSPADFVRAIDEGVWPDKSILLTFDDGYRDFHDHAYPVLRDAGLEATVFLVCDVLEGRTQVWRGPQPPWMPPLMGWSEVLELREAGVHFGSHGLSHALLGELGAEELAEEAEESKALLERRLETDVVLFSYPYGDCTARASAAVEAAGYAAALGVSPHRSSRYEIFRRIVRPARTTLPFRLRVSAAYGPLRAVSHVARGDSR